MPVLRPRRLLLAVPLAVASALVASPAAHADGGAVTGGSTSGGFTVATHAVITGDAGDPLTGGGGTSISISVPPKCWWTPFDTGNLAFEDIDPADPKAMTKWFKKMSEQTTITFVASRLGHPTDAYLASHEGTQYTWYTLNSADGVNCADEGFTPTRGQGPGDWNIPGSGAYPVGYAAFIGPDPAPPLVDVADVVEEVWDRATAEVDAPDLDRNPQIADRADATLVNLQTWFWVQNVQRALAQDGEIHLHVNVPGTPVQADLDASTDGVQVSSAAGAVDCSVEQAKTAWAPGVPDGSACSFAFTRANTGGWPVTSSINWTGTWQGVDSGGPDGGPLAPINQTSTIDVPVAEAQSVVDGVG